MAEPPKSVGADDLPAAVIESSGRRKLPLVWIIPIVAALIGGYLAVKAAVKTRQDQDSSIRPPPRRAREPHADPGV